MVTHNSNVKIFRQILIRAKLSEILHNAFERIWADLRGNTLHNHFRGEILQYEIR